RGGYGVLKVGCWDHVCAELIIPGRGSRRGLLCTNRCALHARKAFFGCTGTAQATAGSLVGGLPRSGACSIRCRGGWSRYECSSTAHFPYFSRSSSFMMREVIAPGSRPKISASSLFFLPSQ